MLPERSTFFKKRNLYILRIMTLTDLKNPFDSAPVYYKEKTGSTMEDMITLRDAGHGAVLFTGFQAAGRGRIPGRQWISNRDLNLLMTLQLKTKKIRPRAYQIPLITGLGIARFLEEGYGLEARIKWPNDVLIEGKKISGILCESRGEWISVGMGLNCGQTVFDEDFQSRSTSISLQTGKECSPRKILSVLLEKLKESYSSPDWRDQILARLYGKNSSVYLQEGLPDEADPEAVVITGLSEEGFLTVRNPESGEVKTVLAGEIRFPDYHTK